jgi:hypothetical protein
MQVAREEAKRPPSGSKSPSSQGEAAHHNEDAPPNEECIEVVEVVEEDVERAEAPSAPGESDSDSD